MQSNILVSGTRYRASGLKLLLVAFVLVTNSFAQDSENKRANSKFWCRINPATPLIGDSIDLSKEKIHFVPKDQQMVAQEELRLRSFVKLSKKDAQKFLGDHGQVDPKTYLYLVRSSAFYADENYEAYIQLAVSFYPKGNILRVINFSLSNPDAAPNNLALVVEVPEKIKSVSVVCLTAS